MEDVLKDGVKGGGVEGTLIAYVGQKLRDPT